MSRPEALSPQAVTDRLSAHPGWTLSADGTSMTRALKFSSFAEAFGFMAECAIFADRIDHHPEWTNVWARLSITLTTHSAKGLTELDFKLAAFMDKAAARRGI